MSEAGEPEAQSAPVAQAIVDISTFSAYLCRLVASLLEEADSASPAFKAAVEDPANQEKIRKFLSDSQAPALLVQRSSSKGIICVLFFFVHIITYSM